MGVIAYLDAGTGSMLVAALAGGVAGIAVVIKTFGRRVVGFILRKPVESAADAATDGEAI